MFASTPALYYYPQDFHHLIDQTANAVAFATGSSPFGPFDHCHPATARHVNGLLRRRNHLGRRQPFPYATRCRFVVFSSPRGESSSDDEEEGAEEQRNRGARERTAVPTATTPKPPSSREPVTIHRHIDPRVHLSQDEAGYGIELEVPGFSKDQIDVEFDREALKIRGSTAVVAKETSASAATEVAAAAADPVVETPEHAPAQAATLPPETVHPDSTTTTTLETASTTSSTGPRKTSIEEVRDESDSEFVDVSAEPIHPGSPIFTESRTASPAPTAAPAPVHRTEAEPEVPSTATPAIHVPRPSTPPLKTPTAATTTTRLTRSFEKIIGLPEDVDRDRVVAQLTDGILRIRLARVVPQAPTRRQIVLA